MRIFGLLMVLLCLVLVCGLVPAGAASDSARQSSSPQAQAIPFSADWFDPSAIARSDFIKRPASHGGDENYSRSDSVRDGDVTCYTMHIFGMRRESPHSDVVEPSGQWTCKRASNYVLKRAEEPGKVPSP